MTPLDLKPYLDKLAEAFPGDELKVEMSLRKSLDGTVSENWWLFNTNLPISGYGDTFESAFQQITSKYNPKKRALKVAAEAL